MKQTAADFLMDKFFDPSFDKWKQEEWFNQAKELEKQQIIEACYFAYNEGCSYMTDGKTEFESFEQYYDETYKNERDN